MAAIPQAILGEESIAFYRRALAILNDAGIPHLVGGAYAFARYTGIERHTKDFDVFICRGEGEADDACHRVLTKHRRALVEQYVKGIELTVAILEERALSPIRITTHHDFFDYTAKYVGNDAQHHFDLRLPEMLVKQLKDVALRAHDALGCRDLSRIDFIVDERHRPWLLELNSMPGFTPKSLLPEAAAQGTERAAAATPRRTAEERDMKVLFCAQHFPCHVPHVIAAPADAVTTRSAGSRAPQGRTAAMRTGRLAYLR